MLNFYSAIKTSNRFSKMEVSSLLFVEYTCMQEETRFGIWSDNNYFAFISSGKKMWRTIYNSYEVGEGEILFVKKGANLAHQFFEGDFCAIFVFIPDEFIKNFLRKNDTLLRIQKKAVFDQDAVIRIHRDELLQNYYQSIQSYLSLSQKPNEQLLILKFEELLLSLFSSSKHRALTDYFVSLCHDQEYQLRRIMEANFAYNLKLEAYAELCNMSLSTFKRVFKQYYNTTPALWLKNKKLELAQHRLLSSDLSISDIAFECGFEDTSHFIRTFKEKYGHPPLKYRHERLKTNRA